jgi:hypothetical protein
MYTVPKTRQISEKIREEVPWREYFPVIRGNEDYFPRISQKFSLQGTSSSSPRKICQIFGQCIHNKYPFFRIVFFYLVARKSISKSSGSFLAVPQEVGYLIR